MRDPMQTRTAGLIDADNAQTRPGSDELSPDAMELDRVAAALPLMTTYLGGVPQNWRAHGSGSVFLGIGLGSSIEPTRGLPFDAVGFLATAAALRDELGLMRVVVLVADTHSLENAWANLDVVQRLGDLVSNSLKRLWAGLELGPVKFTRGSAVELVPDYRALLAKIPEEVSAGYVRREIADIEWHRLHYGATVKLGWIIDPSGRQAATGDERVFDDTYRRIFGDAVAMVYTEAGRRRDPSNPRCSPYALLRGEDRLALDPRGDTGRLPTRTEHLDYLSRVVAAVERYAGAGDGELDARIERIRRLASLSRPSFWRRRVLPDEQRVPVLDALEERGLIADCTDPPGLQRRLAEGPARLYCGFDPTASSLHVGSLRGLYVLELFRRHGHEPILLLGGGTGFIGDPAGRSDERVLLDEETIDANCAALRTQVMRLLRPADELPDIIFVDNRDWIGGMTVVDFLRDPGKFFRVNQMLAKESVKSRLESRAGLSFTEFAYMLLQAQDFAVLRRKYHCELQVGGTDQWGSITAGVDLIRRKGRTSAFGLVWPLFHQADGEKFGKTVEGAIWLDGARTSPFAFYQFWINADDEDVETLLLQFTFLPVGDIQRTMREHRAAPERRIAQRVLAREVTTWVHGAAETRAAEGASSALFSDNRTALTVEALDLLEREIPTVHVSARELDAFRTIEELAVNCGVTSSRAEARRLIASGGLYVNGKRVTDGSSWRSSTERDWLILRRGRRHNHLVRVHSP